MALTPEQRRVLAAIKKIGRQRGASPMEIKAAIETGLVENNLTNRSGGDADSSGWRQERASLYKDPNNLTASINRFFNETRSAKARGKYGNAGDLAAAVQRPAAQYRGRYKQKSALADSLLGSSSGANGTPGTPGTPAVTTSTTVPDSMGQRRAIAQYLLNRHVPGAAANALLDFQSATKTVSGTAPGKAGTPAKTAPGGIEATHGTSGVVAQALTNAAAINAKHMPYLWGGGHGGKVDAKHATPLDCSGAVSAVLGINPRVASQFKTFGSPGDGGSKGITIYAKDDHVLMKINGHFFGTSASNPGGGAGWIPQSAISASYLRGFTARHLAKS